MARGLVALFPPLNDALKDTRAPSLPSASGYATQLFLCVTALTLFRLAMLYFSRTELFFDEAQYWFWSRELAAGYYSKPPLIAWIIRASTEVCGMGEACVRAPSPLLHAATAMAVYGIGRTLYDARIGFWAGLVYATLPGVSFSAGLISTDAPLLLFVALGLLAVAKLRDGAGLAWAAMLGVALGLGLMSKYAMGYFVLCLAAYAAVSPKGRTMLASWRFYVAPLIAALVVAPNIVWNASNRFATFAHTADNAEWSSGGMFHPADAAEFLAGQLGVAGPLLFGAFIWLCIAWARRDGGWRALEDRERLLLAFSLPVLALMLGQAFMSRAHANWAAFAYIAASVLITAAMLRAGWTRLFRASMGLHVAAMLALGAGGTLAGQFVLPGGINPYSRVLGWKAIAEAAGASAEAGGYRAIATDKRALAAELLYYLRDKNIPIVAYVRAGQRPTDHFELKQPLTADTPRPILLVSFKERPSAANDGSGMLNLDFTGCTRLEITAGRKRSVVYFYPIQGSTN